MRPFTRKEIEKCQELRGKGLSYRQIAERFGRSADTIKATFYTLRKRPFEFRREREATEREHLISLFENGYTMSEIARLFGWSIQRVQMRFDRAGFDAEMRKETRVGVYRGITQPETPTRQSSPVHHGSGVYVAPGYDHLPGGQAG